MNVNKYLDFKKLAMQHFSFSSSTFSNFENFVTVENIKYVYPKGWNSGNSKIDLIAITDNSILIWNNVEKTCNIEVMKLSQIRKMVLQQTSEYNFKLTIDFSDGEQVNLSNEEDTSSGWVSTYREYIQEIFRFITNRV